MFCEYLKYLAGTLGDLELNWGVLSSLDKVRQADSLDYVA